MDTTTKIFGVIILLFVVYITVHGELPSYIALFTAKKSGS